MPSVVVGARRRRPCRAGFLDAAQRPERPAGAADAADFADQHRGRRRSRARQQPRRRDLRGKLGIRPRTSLSRPSPSGIAQWNFGVVPPTFREEEAARRRRRWARCARGRAGCRPSAALAMGTAGGCQTRGRRSARRSRAWRRDAGVRWRAWRAPGGMPAAGQPDGRGQQDLERLPRTLRTVTPHVVVRRGAAGTAPSCRAATAKNAT